MAGVHRCMAYYLKFAPHHSGGAGKGCSGASRLTEALDAPVVNEEVEDGDEDGDVDDAAAEPTP